VTLFLLRLDFVETSWSEHLDFLKKQVFKVGAGMLDKL
jgi:hypothetical protein